MTLEHPSVVALSAGLWLPSKTTELASTILRETLTRVSGRSTLIEFGALAKDLGVTLRRDEAAPNLRDALVAVEQADILIAATPVFRGTFTGHFKHFFDLVEIPALLGKPVIVAATGGGEKHCLVLEYGLKPLFGFFQSFTVPTSIYATESDFSDGRVSNQRVHARIQAAVSEAVALLPLNAARQALASERAQVSVDHPRAVSNQQAASQSA